MRITARVAVGGDRGFTRIPVLGCAVRELCDDERGEHLSRAKVIDALRENESIRLDAGDDMGVLAFGCELLHQIEHATKELSERYADRTDSARVTPVPVDHADRIAERNMRKGKYAFVRLDIWRRRDGVVLRVNCDNPRGCVGIADNLTYEFALIMARCAAWIAKELTSPVILEAGPGCPRIFEDAEETEARLAKRKADREANERREACESRHGDYCSPARPDCPCYRCGRCVAIEEGAK